MIFDIETIPYNFDDVDKSTQDLVLRGLVENTFEAEQAKERMCLTPYLGEIVAIGFIVYVPQDDGSRRKLSKVYFQAPTLATGTRIEEENVILISTSERQMLRQFWNHAKDSHDAGYPFVTFNGRSFDAPWIIARSLKYRIKPSVNLLPNRYDNAHIDLKDKLSFYGALRWPTFHIVCNHLGVQTPKNKLDGSQIKNTYEKGEYLKIARYCAQDVKALEEVYNYYRDIIQ